jgi:hypothetical protein
LGVQQSVGPNAVSELTFWFAALAVGAVSGEPVLHSLAGFLEIASWG